MWKQADECEVVVRVQQGWWIFVALGLPALPGSAQQADDGVSTVVVKGELSDTEARRDFVAGKIVISRKRIEESGADNVAELLKREPSVSVSSDGRIGLLGLPGYTQVLVDGAPPEGGKGVHQLKLVHVEKIEIIKSSVAEFGPFGIAGTINVITRKVARKTSTELGVSASAIGSQPGASLTIGHNQSQAGSPLRLGVTLSAGHSRPEGERHDRLRLRAKEMAAQEVWQAATHSRSHSSNADLGGELSWDAGTAHTLRFSPNGGRYATREAAIEERSYANGNNSRSAIARNAAFGLASLPFTWSFKPDRKTQLDMRARLTRVSMDGSETRRETGSVQPGLRESSQDAVSHVKNLELTYKANLGRSHDIKLGASTLRTREAISYRNLIDGLLDPAFDFLGAERLAFSRQTRIYAQDDWRMNESLAFNAGLSGQGTALDLEEGQFDSKTRYRLWAPSLHVVKSLGQDDTRQLRLSIARTYRAPDRNELALRPRLHPLAPCAPAACGANTIDTFDNAGNPDLQPERSLGLNLSYEHGLGGESTVTLEVYLRRIDGKIGADITRGDVAWSAVPRYVSRPANLGDARVQGMNLEMELALRDLSKNAPKLNLRGNISLASSQVSSLPGPDNRLDKQTPWSAKLGGSYSVAGWPLKIDLDANWAPGVWIRTNQSQRIAIPRRFDIDTSLAWTIAPGKRLRLSVADLAPRTAQSLYEYESAGGFVDLHTDVRKYRTVTLRLDTKL